MSYAAIFNILHLYYIMYNFLFLCNPSCLYTCENVCSMLLIGLLFVPSHLSLRLSLFLKLSLSLSPPLSVSLYQGKGIYG